MSNNGTLLPTPDDPRIAQLIADWPEPFQTEAIVSGHYYPRSFWLSIAERILHDDYPTSSSADRKLTARHLAPFPLALGPNVV